MAVLELVRPVVPEQIIDEAIIITPSPHRLSFSPSSQRNVLKTRILIEEARTVKYPRANGEVGFGRKNVS